VYILAEQMKGEGTAAAAAVSCMRTFISDDVHQRC